MFLRATDNYLELAARLVVPVRTARWVKGDMTRGVLGRFAEAGIAVASSTYDVTVRAAQAGMSEPADPSREPGSP